jgi:hypothetical protein
MRPGRHSGQRPAADKFYDDQTSTQIARMDANDTSPGINRSQSCAVVIALIPSSSASCAAE